MENLNSRRNYPLLGMNHLIGKYGRMHMDYLRQCHPDLYQQLILQGTLNQYLSEADNRAQRMMGSLIRDMIRQEGVTEQMKSDDPLMWTARINTIRERAEEIVMDEVVRAL
jgi:hypothetical protein